MKIQIDITNEGVTTVTIKVEHHHEEVGTLTVSTE